MADAGDGGGDHLHKAVVVDGAGGEQTAGFPDGHATAGELAVVVTVHHGAAGEDDGRDVDGGGSHQAGRRGFVATGGEDDTVDGIAVKDFDEAEVGQVTVEPGGGPAAAFMDRMDGEDKRQSAGIAHAVAEAAFELKQVAIAGGKVTAGLGDADDGFVALQLFAGEAVVGEALHVEGGHAGVGEVVKPIAAAEASGAFEFGVEGHGVLLYRVGEVCCMWHTNEVAWEVEFTGEFQQWWDSLTEDQQDDVAVSVRLLGEFGPALGFPASSKITTSRYPQMRELRTQSGR